MSHIVRAFDEDVLRVLTRFEHLMRTALEWTEKSCDALADGKSSLAREVLADNISPEALRRAVVGTCDVVMVRRQPVGNDFRAIVGCRDMSSGMTDICECAKAIGVNIVNLDGVDEILKGKIDFRLIAKIVKAQLKSVVAAHSTGDLGNVNEAWELEKHVIRLRESTHERVASCVNNHSISFAAGMRLMTCCSELGKIAIYGARAAGDVIFMIDGTRRDQQDVLPDEFIGTGMERLLKSKREMRLE